MRSPPLRSRYSAAVACSRAPAESVSSSSALSRSATRALIFRSSAARPSAVAARRPSASARRSARRARSSVAIAACRPEISTPSFSARSAAVACSASGRSRFLTSSSRSRARSTCTATRASFSSARCRRRLNRPRPAASSISSRRSDGFELSTVSTRPCEITERRPPPRPTSDRSSTRSMRRTGVLLTRYCPSPPRFSRRATETSL